MIRKLTLLLVVVALTLLAGPGCLTRMMVPPAVDLKLYQTIGLMAFNSKAEGNLTDYVTRRFLQSITEDQKMLQIIELGTEADVLAAVQKTRLDPDAVQAIGEKYKVKTLVTGDLEISDFQPKLRFAPGLHYVGVSADVEAKLSVRFLNTGNGATLWTGSARQKREVGSVGLSEGHFWFDARDPETAYGSLTDALVRETTQDFRHTWQWQ